MAIKTGWSDAGNGMVKNTSTGQLLPQNHPDYLNAADSGTTATPNAAPDGPMTTPQVPLGDPSAPKPQPTSVPLGDPNAPTPQPYDPQIPLGDPNAPGPQPFNPQTPLGSPNTPSPQPLAAPPTPDPFGGGGQYFPNTGQWVPKNNPAAIAAAQAAEAAAGGSGGGAPGPASPAAPGAPGAPAGPTTAAPAAPPDGPMLDPNAPPNAPGNPSDPLGGAYKDALIKMLTGASADPSLSDPTLKAQSDAFNVQQQRAKENARADLAERAAGSGLLADGGSSGAFDQGLVGLEQRQGEAQGANDAGLLGNELQARRAQLVSAATLAGNTLNADQQRQLQSHLADLDAQIKREQMGQQGGQFSQSLAEQGREADLDAALKKLGVTSQTQLGQGDLDLRKLLGTGQLNLGLLSALFGNQQFGQNLSAQLGMFGAGQSNNNLQALLSALGQAA